MRVFSFQTFFRRRLSGACAAFFLSALLVSCLGVASRVALKSDGSGHIALEYRVARELDILGEQDGNEKFRPVPVGRADLERTVDRIPGLKLLSFSAKENEKDTVYRADCSFNSPEALASFFDASGRQAAVDLAGRRMWFAFPGQRNADPAFRELAEKALRGYEFSLSLELPGKASFDFFDERGNTVQDFPGTCTAGGSTVTYAAAMADLVFEEGDLTLEVRW